MLLGAPLAISAYSIFLYNHALTGSLAPTATFEAVERSSFEPWNFFKGMSGLLFDRENGLFVFAPIYVFALVGARAFFFRERRVFAPYVLVLASYLVVIASFPYWPGAISTMGRYILSVLPLFALPMALVFERARWRRLSGGRRERRSWPRAWPTASASRAIWCRVINLGSSGSERCSSMRISTCRRF